MPRYYYTITTIILTIFLTPSPPSQTSEAFMETANMAFMKAGARGLSILFASGDQVPSY